MKKRRPPKWATKRLRHFELELAEGLTISDICRKANISETTYDRRSQGHAPWAKGW